MRRSCRRAPGSLRRARSLALGAAIALTLASCSAHGARPPFFDAPPALAIAPPIWVTRAGSDAVLVSGIGDQFVASLSRSLVAAGFRLVEPSGAPGSEPTSIGRVTTELSAVESGGGVRTEVTLTATLRVAASGDGATDADHAPGVVTAIGTGELSGAVESLDDVSTILARLRIATAREAAARLGEEAARLWATPGAAPPALVRKLEPITNAWAVPVAGRLPLGPWDPVEVGLDAAPGLEGSVLVGGAPTAVPLVETRRGHYAARFRIPPGIAPGPLMLTARLLDASGQRAEVELAPGALLADSDRPLPPAGLVVRRTGAPGAGSFALSWAWRPENGVVHHYGVFRSDGFPYRFSFVGRTSDTHFDDPVVPDEHGFFDLTRRYYTVLGYDAAGNPSPPSELVSIAPDAASTAGTAIFGPGRLRAEEAAAKRDQPAVTARYRIRTVTRSVLRTTLAGRELGDPRAEIILATGRAIRERAGASELDVLVLGSESAIATVSVGRSPRAWPLAEIEPGTYAAAIPLDLIAGDADPSDGVVPARARLTDSAGFDVQTRFVIPVELDEPGSTTATAPEGADDEAAESEH